MPCFAVVLALAFPRLVIVGCWLFTSWFQGVFSAPVWPVLGFFFLPTTTLWYAGVHHWYGGQWTTWPVAGLVIALLLDGAPGMLGRLFKSGKKD
jgi:hypothetical protein